MNDATNGQAQPRIESAQKTYFFSRADGSWFACNVEEAWNTYKAKKFKYVGVSDGRLFQGAVAEAHKIQREQGLPSAQEKLREAINAEYELAKQNTTPPPNRDYKDMGRI